MESAKELWERIESLCDETLEMRKNQRQILMSQYEAFMIKPNEDLSEVFE